MKNFVGVVSTVLVGLIFSASAMAQSLKVGDAAPAISVGKWVKGDGVKSFESGKIYVVEFWATWCGPCVKAIPHVSELQAKYKDKGVIFSGVSVWEEDPAQAKVPPFVEKMGDKMNYNVATDDRAGGGEGKMAETWMKAAGQNGIPCSFLIDRSGKIAWIGHPMELETQLEKLAAK